MTILHNNQNIWLLYKIVVRPVGLVGVELMRENQVRISHNFYGLDKNAFFFYKIIKPTGSEISTDGIERPIIGD